MTDDNVTQLPEPGVILNLDTLKRPEKDIKKPFVIVIGDKQITFKDPAEVDWQDLAGIEVPADLFSVALDREDRNFFREQRMEAWKFNELMEAYYTHYDFEDKIRAAQRRASFSG